MARKRTRKKKHIGFRGLKDHIRDEYLRKGYSWKRASYIGQAKAGEEAHIIDARKRKGKHRRRRHKH